MTQDEVVKMALKVGATKMQPYDYGAEPDRLIIRYGAIERFYNIAFAAGAAHKHGGIDTSTDYPETYDQGGVA